MKINPNFILREVMNIYVVIGVGDEAYTPNVVMSLNDTGAFLWRILEKENGASEEVLIESLIREYEVDSDTAKKDIEIFLNQLRERTMIIE